MPVRFKEFLPFYPFTSLPSKGGTFTFLPFYLLVFKGGTFTFLPLYLLAFKGETFTFLPFYFFTFHWFMLSSSSRFVRLLERRGILCCPPSLPFVLSQSLKRFFLATMISSGWRVTLWKRFAS